ncbi:hypothetical protein BKA70DRAFT_5106 [Coprinopsis sp. MPI-PUGE-AT-0042]|nr:hypothetical protein BKA70DRAFT_5106 [Coprinopsis sp. MPI-PUGE-AT-0042]
MPTRIRPLSMGCLTRSPARSLDTLDTGACQGIQQDDDQKQRSRRLMASPSSTLDLGRGSTSRQDTLVDPPTHLPSPTTPSVVSPPSTLKVTPKPAELQVEMSKQIDGLVAVTTEMEYERYSRGFTYPKEYNEYTIPSCTRSFPGPSIPPQWTTYVHPEGMRYFFKKTRAISVLTEARIDEPDQLAKIEDYISKITSFISENDVLARLEASTTFAPGPSKQQQQPGLLLVLELRKSGRCGYYFVDHDHQCLFWLDPFDFSGLVDQVRMQHTSGLVGIQMKSHYWYHNELFPHLYKLTDENLNEIEDILTFAIGDVATSGSSSTINYDVETLKLMHSMVLGFQRKDPGMRDKSIGGAWFIFRLLATFYGERFMSLHGEKGARLSSSQTIYSSTAGSSDSWFLRLISLFMFLGPTIHAQRLKKLTLDSIVSKREWSKLRERLVEEWREGILYATVILTANVAFLTIQSVDEAGVKLGHRTHAQRACDFSIVTSMGTIMWGLVLGREYRETMSTKFIANRSASRAGIELLAIIYSLPNALLMWSMLSFFIAFCITWYSSGDKVVTVLISAACGLVALLIFWGAAVKYENEPYWGICPQWARNKWHSLKERRKERATRRQNVMSVETTTSQLDPEKFEMD